LYQQFVKAERLIIGGDLNLTTKIAEKWGHSVRKDPLADFFLQKLVGRCKAFKALSNLEKSEEWGGENN